MTSVSSSQLTLNFEPSVVERFDSLEAFVAFRAQATAKSMKTQAADMDLSPSVLSRKLNPNEGDTSRFTLRDLESWLESTGEASAVIEYLAAKYLDSDKARQSRALSQAEELLKQLAGLLPALKEST